MDDREQEVQNTDHKFVVHSCLHVLMPHPSDRQWIFHLALLLHLLFLLLLSFLVLVHLFFFFFFLVAFFSCSFPLLLLFLVHLLLLLFCSPSSSFLLLLLPLLVLLLLVLLLLVLLLSPLLLLCSPVTSQRSHHAGEISALVTLFEAHLRDFYDPLWGSCLLSVFLLLVLTHVEYNWRSWKFMWCKACIHRLGHSLSLTSERLKEDFSWIPPERLLQSILGVVLAQCFSMAGVHPHRIWIFGSWKFT